MKSKVDVVVEKTKKKLTLTNYNHNMRPTQLTQLTRFACLLMWIGKGKKQC